MTSKQTADQTTSERVIDNALTGERIVIRQTAAQTGGRMLAFDLFLPPGGHVPAGHVHPVQEERFTVTWTETRSPGVSLTRGVIRLPAIASGMRLPLGANARARSSEPPNGWTSIRASATESVVSVAPDQK